MFPAQAGTSSLTSLTNPSAIYTNPVAASALTNPSVYGSQLYAAQPAAAAYAAQAQAAYDPQSAAIAAHAAQAQQLYASQSASMAAAGYPSQQIAYIQPSAAAAYYAPHLYAQQTPSAYLPQPAMFSSPYGLAAQQSLFATLPTAATVPAHSSLLSKLNTGLAAAKSIPSYSTVTTTSSSTTAVTLPKTAGTTNTTTSATDAQAKAKEVLAKINSMTTNPSPIKTTGMSPFVNYYPFLD